MWICWHFCSLYAHYTLSLSLYCTLLSAYRKFFTRQFGWLARPGLFICNLNILCTHLINFMSQRGVFVCAVISLLKRNESFRFHLSTRTQFFFCSKHKKVHVSSEASAVRFVLNLRTIIFRLQYDFTRW